MLIFFSVLTSAGTAAFDVVLAGRSRVESAPSSIARITVSGVGMNRLSLTIRARLKKSYSARLAAVSIAGVIFMNQYDAGLNRFRIKLMPSRPNPLFVLCAAWQHVDHAKRCWSAQ